MGWFLRVMEELAIECRVGHPTAIRKAESRRQKHDRRDAALLLQLLAEDRFPTIWMPSTEVRARFPDGKAVASYVGMIPSEYSSGKRQRLGALSKQGNPFLRFLWCEAGSP